MRAGELQPSLIALVSILIACSQVRPAPPVTAAPPPAAAPADKVTLVFSAAVAGQLVPCGCSPDQKGGLPRTVALVDKLRKEEPNFLFVDAGDLLFENPSPPPKQMITQRQMKARVLAQGDQLMQAAARVVGQRDLALGPQFVSETADGVPLLDASRPSLLAGAGGVKVGLLAAESAADVAARARGLKDQGARLVVLLLHPKGDNSFAAAQAMLADAGRAGVDLVVLGRRDDPATDENRKDPGPPPLLAVEGHGQSLLRVDVHLGKGPLGLAPSPEDRDQEIKAIQVRIDRFRSQIELYPQRKPQLEAKIKDLQGKQDELRTAPLEKPAEGSTWAQAAFVPISEKIAPDPAAQKLVDAYDQKVAEINLAEARTQPEKCPPAGSGELAYTGANSCVECHQDAAAFWTQTRHAHAYETLVAVKKQFSLDCIRCHVTGWQQPGGVCRIDRTEVGEPGIDGSGVGRRDVQCEACHGPGSEHVADPTAHIRAEVTTTVCMRCHEPANSPKFDDRKYRPFIVGPGHGQPLAKGQKPKPKEGYPE